MKNTVSKRILLLLFVIMSLMYVVCRAIQSNPDPDAYWLIENGRYVIENKMFPTINPWVSVNALDYIMQQPLCSLFNYLGFSVCGINHLYILALFENIFMCFVFYLLAMRMIHDKSISLIATCIFDMVLAKIGSISTRPYQITIALSILCIYFLVRYKDSEKSFKDRLFISLSLCCVSFIQTNWQMSFWILPYIWCLCFIVPDVRVKGWYKNIRLVDIIHTIITACFMFVCSLLNPYHMDGLLYLYNSKNCLSIVSRNIRELKRPDIMSFNGLLIGIAICFIIGCIVAKKQSWIAYMLIGTTILSMSANRNIWFVVLSISLCCVYLLQYVFISVANTKKLNVIFVYCILVIANVAILFTVDYKKIKTQSYYSYPVIANTLSNKEDVCLYTDFNTGGYLEFSGFNIFVDARPEIFSQEISKSTVLDDWMNIEVNNGNCEELIDKYGFNYFAVYKGTNMDRFLSQSDDYAFLIMDNGAKLYMRKD